MKVLVIPSWYPNGTDKLMGIYHKEFCEALASRENVEVDMLYIDRQRLNAPMKYLFMKKKEIVKEKNYKVYITKMLDVHKISEDLQMERYTKVLEKSFLEYVNENGKPDILHAQVTLPAGYATCVIGKKYNIPVVITEHASYFKRFFEGKNKKYGNFCLKNAYFTTVSKYMAKEMSKYTKTCSVLPNLVDTETFIKNRKNKKVNGLKIIQVSGLRQGKRFDDTMKALKYILEQEKIDASLTIVGDGFLEEDYKKKCYELGMDKHVLFVGRKTKDEIAKILQEHNIFVISSDKETFAIPGIEALAGGLPVVSTKCLGPEEYIDDKCGKLVPVGDTEDMANAILEVYHNLDKYDKSYMEKVANNYSSKTVTDIALKIYHDLLK